MSLPSFDKLGTLENQVESVEQDQMTQNAASDQGLQYLS